MIGKDCIETTAAQVTAELLRLCFRPDERVSIITEPVEASPGSSPNLRTAGLSLLVLLGDRLHGAAFVQECRQCGCDAWIILIRLEGTIEDITFTGQNPANFAHPLA